MNLRELAGRLGCELAGDGDLEITGVAGMEYAQPGQLTFLANPKYAHKVKHTRASAILVSAPLGGQYNERGQPVGPSAPCQRPPWGKLVAVNANTGDIAWESVLGLNENLPEGKQLVGSAGSAGPSVTAGGLVFVGNTSDRRFRAFDARTGRELWSAMLENNAGANPMSYAGRSGKQRVAIIAGDTVNVFALP